MSKHITKFDKYINWNILSFLNDDINWKEYFSTEVLPYIDKGWKLVASENGYLCINCYHYGNGSDRPCINHFDCILSKWMSYTEYKDRSILDCPKLYYDFKNTKPEDEITYFNNIDNLLVTFFNIMRI